MTTTSLKEKVRKERWYYMFKIENGQRVYVYEPLAPNEARRRQMRGWQVRRI